MTATGRGPRKRTPLRYDWSRADVYLDEGDGWGTRVRFHRARDPNGTLILNAQRKGGGWQWTLIAWPIMEQPPIMEFGSAATMTDAKVKAEQAAKRYGFGSPQQTIWRNDHGESESVGDLPF